MPADYINHFHQINKAKK
ncbi:hypothetical protein D046_5066A, partial [Vibrio parahaemolyticus V-223/04]